MDSFIIEKEFNIQYPILLVEQISEFLTNAVIEGHLHSGQRLVETELQRKFGTSRGPIRESFRILEQKGLVVIIPRKGTFVRTITQKDIEENFPIRSYLESLAARLAVSNLGPKDIEGMEIALSRMRGAAERNDFKSYLKYHSEYHELFINVSKNDTLIEILTNLRRQAIWFRFSYLYIQESFEYALRVHREIIDLFIKKDIDPLEALVREHIMIALDRFLQFLKSKNGDFGKNTLMGKE